MASSNRKAIVCLRCAEIKQGCKGGIPCDRCTRLNLPCRPKNGGGLLGMPAASEEPKARIRRVQTGCVTCKRRKKKCDERKPQCGDCRRLCLDCVWPLERPGKRRSGSSNEDWGEQQQQQQQEQGWHATTASGAVDGSQPLDLPSLSLGRSRSPSRSNICSNESNLDVSVADMLCQMSSSSINNNSETPLQDLFPWSFSPDLSWLDIFPQSPPPGSAISPENLQTTTTASLCLYTPALIPDLKSPHDKALLNHYSTIVASVLSRSPDTQVNPYLSYLLPIATSNQLVLHCVLALSATHWQRLQPRMRDRALFHQGQATKSLALLLSHLDGNLADIALVSCLLLCMTELFDGTSTGWKLHLQGAKRLLSTLKCQNDESKMTGHYKFFVKLARFLDSATTTSTCKPPLIDDQTGNTTFEPAGDVNGEDAAVYGIPKELFHLVDRVNELASKRGTRVDEASEALFRQEASRVHGQLDKWAYDFGGLSGAVASLAPKNDDVLNATTAFEWALQLRLHQVTEGYSLTDRKAAECVEHILDSTQKIRYGSSLESCLLFPLVMAGGACDRLEQRMVIQDRLMVMERTCGFGYIHQSRELVETVWDRRDATEARVNWARIRYEEMGGLALF